MKTKKILWYVAALSMVAAGLSACSKAGSDGNGEGQTGNTRFRVTVNEETLTAESVTVSVTCTGGSDTWYCFITDDTESDITKAITDELKGVTDYQSLLKVGNQSVTFNNLTERTKYRVIVTGLLSDGQLVGTADDETFTTPLPEGKWITNEENWSCGYLRRGDMTLEDGSKMYADILLFTISGGDDFYLPAVVSAREFRDEYNSDIAAFAKAEIAVVQEEIDLRNSMGDNAMWQDYLLDSKMEGSLGILDSGDQWYAVMLGVDFDGKGTGLYVMSEPFNPQEETAVPEYEKWIGTWRIADKNTPGYYYIVEITADENNYQYLVDGWEGPNGNQVNNDIDFPPFHARYDKTTQTLAFMAEPGLWRVDLADIDVPFEYKQYGRADIGLFAFYDNDPNDKIFDTISDSYPIATAEMDADGNVTVTTEPIEITDSNGSTYTVNLLGMWYAADLIDYKDSAGRGGYSLSFDYRVPRFPYVMTKIDDSGASEAGTEVTAASVNGAAPVATNLVRAAKTWSMPRFAKQ